MGEFDNHVGTIGDGMPTSPSRISFFMDDDVVSSSVTELPGENKNGPLSSVMHELFTSANADFRNGGRVGFFGDQMDDSGVLMEQNMSSRGGLRERMASRAGFNGLTLNTESIRPGLTHNQESRPPYSAFSPGLSPTVLLDSPVFLSNSLVQPSPTTGKFPFALSSHGWNPTFTMDTLDKSKDDLSEGLNASSFTFKPVEESRQSVFMGAPTRSMASIQPLQAFPNTEAIAQSENSRLPQSIGTSGGLSQPGAMIHPQADLSRSLADKDTGHNNIRSEPRSFHSGPTAEQSPPLDDQQDEDVDQRGSTEQNIGAPAEDGFNWRKYGQKQVKGSEYPRSYYKCTHANCPVKKKVERSQEGHITEIIYKGAHNHPKPPPNRRSALGSSSGLGDIPPDKGEQAAGFGGGDPAWGTTQKASGAGASDWRHDNFEVTSSAHLGNEYGNGPTSLQQGGTAPFECGGDTVDGSSTFSNDEDEDDRGTGSVSLVYDGEGDESESKRRKLETYATELSGATRAIREPRVVVQTTSEVDILDDGYRWRKYGQKVVKGNPNPRSYYKCTSAGCTVRKHVERASHDLKSVITTYEGKHNHDVPAARNSSHASNPGSSNALPMQAAASSNTPQLHHSMSRFERPPAFSAFNLPGRPHIGPPQGFGFGMSQQGLANFAAAGLGPTNQGKVPPVLPVHHYLGHQPRPMSNVGGFMMPKDEPKVEPMSDNGMNISGGSSVYSQMLSRLPLGP